MVKTSELEAAYLATTYRVFLPAGQVDLRIGEANETLRAWLEKAGYNWFSIVTAYNPGSRPADAGVNAERQSQLECELLEGHYEPFVGENIADDGRWPDEESCFVPELAPVDARALGEAYGQNAVVCGSVDGVPHLLWVTVGDESAQ